MVAKRTDRNQSEIVEALRDMGATVGITSAVGKGFPDLVVGYRGRNYLIEIKDGRRPPSGRRLTKHEEKFQTTWKGQVGIISSVDEAIAFLSGCLVDMAKP